MTGMDISGLLEKADQEMKVGRYEQALATEPSNWQLLRTRGNRTITWEGTRMQSPVLTVC